MKAAWSGVLLAESSDCVVVEGNEYFPLDDVRMELLEPSRHRSLCPWKGVASYYDVVADGLRNPGAAWSYRHPSPLARKIKGRIAFWKGVEIWQEERPGGQTPDLESPE